MDAMWRSCVPARRTLPDVSRSFDAGWLNIHFLDGFRTISFLGPVVYGGGDLSDGTSGDADVARRHGTAGVSRR
jgi:hypothetical protein